jgi:hypothetical protein
MKIGLRSVDGTYNMNYGSSLQCFALYSFLSNLFADDQIYYLKQWGKPAKEPKTFDFDLYGKKLAAVDDCRLLDKCIIGSDCVMYFNEGTLRDSDRIFFMLDYDIERILYAMGSNEPQSNISEECSEFLKTMEYVSIRDIDNQKFIPNSIVNIDPTLLFGEDWWNVHVERPDGFDETELNESPISYCPWFMVDNTGWFKKPDGCIECFHNENIKSPFQFLWVLKNCKEIHSYSFHAFIFSLIFNKRLFIHNAKGNFKLCNLMKLLNIRLEDGVFVNREEVFQNIVNQRKSSELYLKYMIGRSI